MRRTSKLTRAEPAFGRLSRPGAHADWKISASSELDVSGHGHNFTGVPNDSGVPA